MLSSILKKNNEEPEDIVKELLAYDTGVLKRCG